MILTNIGIERLNREFRRRTKVFGTLPDENTALMLGFARLRHMANAHGSYSRWVLEILAYMMPFLVVGMVAGNIAHKRIDGSTFTKMVYGVLLVSGAFMFA